MINPHSLTLVATSVSEWFRFNAAPRNGRGFFLKAGDRTAGPAILGAVVATVSAGENKVTVFERKVERFDLAAGNDDEGDFGGVSASVRALVKLLEQGVVSTGGDGGSVKRGAHLGSALLDVGLSCCWLLSRA